MSNRKHIKLVHEGRYAAEVEIEIVDSNDAWSPYISLEDATKIDMVRSLLRQGNITEANKYAEKVYILKPVAA